jgi:RNA-binding protein
MVEKMSKKELVKMGSEIKPTVHVGKEGLTEGIVEEVRNQVKRNKVVKVRVLPAAGMDKDELAAELEERTGTRCVETRGFTVLLCEPKVYEEKKPSAL